MSKSNDNSGYRFNGNQYNKFNGPAYAWPSFNESRYRNQYFQNSNNVNYRPNYFYRSQTYRPLNYRSTYRFEYDLGNKDSFTKESIQVSPKNIDKNINVLEIPPLDKFSKMTSKIFDNVLSDSTEATNIQKNNSLNANNLEKTHKVSKTINSVEPINSKVNANVNKPISKKKKKLENIVKAGNEKNKSKKLKNPKGNTYKKQQLANKANVGSKQKDTNNVVKALNNENVEIRCNNDPVNSHKYEISNSHLFCFGNNAANDSNLFEANIKKTTEINSHLNENNNTNDSEKKTTFKSKNKKNIVSLKVNSTNNSNKSNSNTPSTNKEESKITSSTVINKAKTSNQTDCTNLDDLKDPSKQLSKYRLKKLLEGPKTKKDQIALENLLQSHYKATQKSSRALRQQDISSLDIASIKLVSTTDQLSEEINSVIDIIEESDIIILNEVDALSDKIVDNSVSSTGSKKTKKLKKKKMSQAASDVGSVQGEGAINSVEEKIDKTMNDKDSTSVNDIRNETTLPNSDDLLIKTCGGDSFQENNLEIILQISLKEEEIVGCLESTNEEISSLQNQLINIHQRLEHLRHYKTSLSAQALSLQNSRIQLLRSSIQNNRHEQTSTPNHCNSAHSTHSLSTSSNSNHKSSSNPTSISLNLPTNPDVMFPNNTHWDSTNSNHPDPNITVLDTSERIESQNELRNSSSSNTFAYNDDQGQSDQNLCLITIQPDDLDDEASADAVWIQSCSYPASGYSQSIQNDFIGTIGTSVPLQSRIEREYVGGSTNNDKSLSSTDGPNLVTSKTVVNESKAKKRKLI